VIDDVAAPANAAPGVASLRRLLRRPEVLVIALIGALLRAWILLSAQGELIGDEAYTGLQAAEIARGHFPVVIGGAAYTGTLDTYVLAPIVGLFGQHVVLLKLMSPVLWAAAAIVMVGAARRVVSDRVAVLAGALVWLAPGALAVLSTRSYVAYALGLILVTGTMWAASVVLSREVPRPLESAVAGALAGLAFYTHPMFAAVVGPVAAVLVCRRWRHLREFWAPAVGAALVVNLPFLIWNARHDWASLDQPPNDAGATYSQRLRGFFAGLLPRDLGVRGITGDGRWIVGRPLGVLVLMAVLGGAVFGAVRLMRTDPWRGAVVAAPLVLCWPLMAGLTNLAFVADGRYGVIAFPVLVLALAAAIEPLLGRRRTPALACFAAAWVLVCSVPFLVAEAGGDLGDPNARTQQLIDAIEAEGFDRVAGNYFAVLPIEYVSDARIRVAIAGNPYIIRLPQTQRLVESTPPARLAYVFAPGPIDPSWVKLPVDQYRQIPVAGYTLYIPTMG
jgi:hypothetical protein